MRKNIRINITLKRLDLTFFVILVIVKAYYSSSKCIKQNFLKILKNVR